MTDAATIVVVMGVSGSGKTTIGLLLANAMQCRYLEGDSLHSAANITKMSHGIPLTDTDRAPWLTAIHAELLKACRHGESLVVGCSALKASYRTVLAEGVPIVWVYLKGSAELIRARMEHRQGHYMKADMLASQFAALEEPRDAVVADISQMPEAIVEQVLAALRTSAAPSGGRTSSSALTNRSRPATQVPPVTRVKDQP